MDTFGERLRYLRKSKGLSQKELARLLNLDSSSIISQYETLNRIPNVQILQEMARILNCSMDYLLARTNELKETHHPEMDEKTKQLVRELGLDVNYLHINGPKELTDEDKEDLKNFIQLVMTKRPKFLN